MQSSSQRIWSEYLCHGHKYYEKEMKKEGEKKKTTTSKRRTAIVNGLSFITICVFHFGFFSFFFFFFSLCKWKPVMCFQLSVLKQCSRVLSLLSFSHSFFHILNWRSVWQGATERWRHDMGKNQTTSMVFVWWIITFDWIVANNNNNNKLDDVNLHILTVDGNGGLWAVAISMIIIIDTRHMYAIEWLFNIMMQKDAEIISQNYYELRNRIRNWLKGIDNKSLWWAFDWAHSNSDPMRISMNIR